MWSSWMPKKQLHLNADFVINCLRGEAQVGESFCDLELGNDLRAQPDGNPLSNPQSRRVSVEVFTNV